MRVLLDTHTLLWHRDGSSQLGATAEALIADTSNQVVISIVTLWEIAIKRSLGKLTTAKSPAELLKIYQSSGAELLAISPEHVKGVEALPWHHRDPFDRMLIAQAKAEGLTLLSKDNTFRHYDVAQAWLCCLDRFLRRNRNNLPRHIHSIVISHQLFSPHPNSMPRRIFFNIDRAQHETISPKTSHFLRHAAEW